MVETLEGSIYARTTDDLRSLSRASWCRRIVLSRSAGDCSVVQSGLLARLGLATARRLLLVDVFAHRMAHHKTPPFKVLADIDRLGAPSAHLTDRLFLRDRLFRNQKNPAQKSVLIPSGEPRDSPPLSHRGQSGPDGMSDIPDYEHLRARIQPNSWGLNCYLQPNFEHPDTP